MKWVLLAVVATATYFDLKSRRIPNWLIYPPLAFSIFDTLLNSNRKFEDIEYIFLTLVIAILFAVVFGNWIGAGDIKLATIIAIYSHMLGWTQYWIYISLLIGGLFGLIFRRKSLPFAPFMALGLLLSKLVENVAQSGAFL